MTAKLHATCASAYLPHSVVRKQSSDVTTQTNHLVHTQPSRATTVGDQLLEQTLLLGSPGVLTAGVCVYWNAHVISLVLPDCTAWRIIVVVDGVIEVHDTLLFIPVKSIG